MGTGTTRISSIDQGSTWIHLYNESGQKYKTLSVSSVGEIVGYSSTFFISRTTHWIYTWDRYGKKINTRAAR